MPPGAGAGDVRRPRDVHRVGVSGSFDFVFRGTIDAAGHAEGQLTITGANGDLKGLTGMVQLSGQSGVGGSYSGTITR